MYSKKTMATFTSKARARLDYWNNVPVEDIRVSFSMSNRKIPCASVSFLPVFTCPGCANCMWECYDIKACLRFPAVMDARARNTSLLLRAPGLFWKQVHAFLTTYKGNAFRFHVGGDIMNAAQLRAMYDTARLFPQIAFWTYTKSCNIVNEYPEDTPANLSIMFSPWTGSPIENPDARPVFICRYPDPEKNDFPPAVFDNIMQCPGKCEICLKSGRGCPSGESAWTWLH